MRTVLQVEYVGDLAPYEYESSRMAQVGAHLAVARCASADELVAAAHDAEVIWLEWTPHMTAEVLAQLPHCRFVMRWGVGFDQIDVVAATELGIAVANAPSYCSQDVAEHAMALLLSVSRQVVFRHEQMRAGLWRSGPANYRRLSGSTIGVIGLGRIGRQFAGMAKAFGARVLGYDVLAPVLEGVETVDLATLLAESDFVSLHVPMSTENAHLINADSLASMKTGAVLVNSSRGGLVDLSALSAALDSGQLSAAALDVFEQEPLPADHPIRQVPNVVLTPHEASMSANSLADLRAEICDATTEWFETGWASSIVNPQVKSRLRGVNV